MGDLSFILSKTWVAILTYSRKCLCAHITSHTNTHISLKAEYQALLSRISELDDDTPLVTVTKLKLFQNFHYICIIDNYFSPCNMENLDMKSLISKNTFEFCIYFYF